MIVLVAAYDENRCIGKDNKIPWCIKEDMKHFRKLTIGHVIIMGRNTFESLPNGKPLEKRMNLIVTKNCIDFRAKQHGKQINHQFICSHSLEDAISIAEQMNDVAKKEQVVFIIGGGQVYKYALENNLVNKMIISKVHGTYNGNVFFPEFDEDKWESKVVSQHERFDVIEYLPKV